MSGECRDQCDRQALPCAAIGTGVRAASGEVACDTGHGRVVDRALTRTIFAQRLMLEHGQGFRGWKPPLAMRWQQRFQWFKQLRAGEYIEEREGVRLSQLTANLLLLDSDMTVRLHQGWSRMVWGCLGDTILSFEPALLATQISELWLK